VVEVREPGMIAILPHHTQRVGIVAVVPDADAGAFIGAVQQSGQ
jgi:hypothetical protein